MLIRWDATPNPDALKLVPDRFGGPEFGCSFRLETHAPGECPLADRLFEVEGVARVHVDRDFVTVVRSPRAPGWDDLRPAVILALAAHLATGAPHIVAETPQSASNSEVEAEIRAVIERHIQPGVARDGGQIVLESFDAATGVASIRMEGACGGCPASRQTLKATVERLVCRYVPEVSSVVAGQSPAPAPRPPWWTGRANESGSGRRIAFTHRGRSYRGEG